jgi:undecaprenyl-diphosphatase
VNTLLELDARLSQQLRVAENPGALRTLAGILAHSGDSWFWLLGLGIVWFLGDAYWRGLAALFSIGILVTALIVMAIKFTVRRKRPEGEWGSIYRRTDPHSFPSGHAARAVLLAVLAVGAGPLWLACILLPWSVAVVLARVAMGLHYLSDVLAGALIGILVGGIILIAPMIMA